MDLAMRYDTGKLFFDARDFITAAGWFAEVVDAAPEHEAARMYLARAYYHSAQLGRAEDQLREVLRRNPVEAYAHLMLGRTLQRQGRDGEAVGHMRLSAAMTGGSLDL
ncbi:MAG TPA: tetratricopeptide repeat protein [Stackebrandtia sp.]|uniref:tetratricopeptide repeat protein n=1 Tax=Stackebrandtia sp. TaxID=2023065 RepID=UPI002D256302|nr:tetratricopeptide repeat protein [Stackebrandtia sp.]HZE41426.1 tetratricopeptide repeat protein [Stackebrandtia sp.]